MGVVNIRTKGTYDSTSIYLEKLTKHQMLDLEYLTYIAEKGVSALAEATPAKTGKTAACWYYTIERTNDGRIVLSWKNSNMAGDVPVVILIDRGHANSAGTYVSGRHFIRRAIDPVLAELSQHLEEEVGK